MRGINIGGLTECKAFKHFREELIIICQQESGLKYWGSSAPSRNILGRLQPPPSYAYANRYLSRWRSVDIHCGMAAHTLYLKVITVLYLQALVHLLVCM